jgi:hypothetical protein
MGEVEEEELVETSGEKSVSKKAYNEWACT